LQSVEVQLDFALPSTAIMRRKIPFHADLVRQHSWITDLTGLTWCVKRTSVIFSNVWWNAYDVMQLLCLGMSVSDSESQWFNLLNSSNIHIQFIYEL